MVARIAFRPLLRVLSRARKRQAWAELKLLLKDRRLVKRVAANEDPHPPILFQMASGYWLSQAIYAVAKLGIADLLQDGPQSSVTLAAATSCDTRSLFRVLRALSSVGILSQVDKDGFALAPVGNSLRSNVPGSLKALVITLGEIHYQACGALLHSVRTGSPAFNQVFGAGLFEYLQQTPESAFAFNQGMTNLACLLARAVLLAYDFSGIRSIVDVGGGEGELVRRIVELYPEMTGLVFDLPNVPPVISRTAHGADRCSYMPGNFFDWVPENAEAYLLCGVIHDWSDELAMAILSNCRKAMAKNGRVLIVEAIVPETRFASFSKLLDVNMMVMTPGCERTKREFQSLLDGAALQVTRIIPTMAPQSIIEATAK